MFKEVLFPVEMMPITRNGRPTKRNKIFRPDTGETIAIVSNQYTLITNSDIDNIIREMFNVNITDSFSDGFISKFNYKVDTVQGEVSKGDVVQMMIAVENSYDGSRKLKISLDALRLACINGMIIGETVYEAKYLHKSRSVSSILEEIQVSISNADKLFNNVISKLKSLKNKKLTEEDKIEIVKRLASFPKYIHEPIFNKLISNKNETMYDVYNVVTYFTTHELKINNVSRLNIVSDLNKAILTI